MIEGAGSYTVVLTCQSTIQELYFTDEQVASSASVRLTIGSVYFDQVPNEVLIS